jgi:fluoroquinolone transport system permease protein
MTRLSFTLWREALVQARAGFYAVGGFMAILWAALFTLLPDDVALDVLLPGFVAMNLIVTTFYFGAALLLLERAEGSLAALAVTPLLADEALLARSLSLALLAAAETLIVIILAAGFDYDVLPLLAGMLALGCLYTLLGWALAARYTGINDFLPPSVLAVTLLMLPLADHFGIFPTVLVYAHPVQPSLTLLRIAFEGGSAGEALYGLIGSVVWLGAAWWLARRAYVSVLRQAAV